MALFDGSRTKVSQAVRHIASVKLMLAEHAASIVYEPEPPRVDAHGRLVISFGSLTYRGLPETVSATIGDAIHNLRASLDLMAADMALRNGQSTKGLSFPFADSEEALQRTISERRFSRCGEAAVAAAMDVKPYPGGSDLLYHIHKLDILDKHHVLLPIANAVGSPVLDRKTMTLVGDPTKPSEVRYHWPDENPLKGQDVLGSLDRMVEVTSSVIDRFEAALS